MSRRQGRDSSRFLNDRLRYNNAKERERVKSRVHERSATHRPRNWNHRRRRRGMGNPPSPPAAAAAAAFCPFSRHLLNYLRSQPASQPQCTFALHSAAFQRDPWPRATSLARRATKRSSRSLLSHSPQARTPATYFAAASWRRSSTDCVTEHVAPKKAERGKGVQESCCFARSGCKKLLTHGYQMLVGKKLCLRENPPFLVIES